MGTKISQLTETGSAPTGAMVPIEYEDANYRVNAGDFNNKGAGKYVSPWQEAGDTDTFTVTHNLGTPDVIVRVFVNTSASNTNAQSIEGVNEWSQGHGSAFGYSVTNITPTSCTVQLGYGYWDISTAGTLVGTNFTAGGVDKWVKFVVLGAGRAPSDALYDTDWIDGTEAGSPLSAEVSGGANFTLTHNAGTDRYVAQWQVADDADGTNSVVIDYSDQGSARRGGRMYELEANSLKFRTYPTYTTFAAGGEGTYNSMDNRYVRFILSASADAGGPRAAVSFSGWDGGGGTTINTSSNVSSIVEHEEGDLSIYFTDSLDGALAVGTASAGTGSVAVPQCSPPVACNFGYNLFIKDQNATGVRIETRRLYRDATEVDSTWLENAPIVNVVVF